ncbi:UDP-glucose 4-epimerase GalE [Pseudochelatococcus lubricantis]|uniref:UDP-glucose 4-epimerase GalE n=1 Tax=Pseudochelatococcus lubricantis TaxID=1538102 RepID=UPI0035F04498
MSNILVTGGAGFIGAHICEALVRAGLRPVIYDNLTNSSSAVIERLERLAGLRPLFIHADIRDARQLDTAFAHNTFAAVIHLAALKAVGDSVAQPLQYYDVNVAGTLALLAAMRRANVRTLVFSSSATVYGEAATVPIREDFPRRPANPYGRTKVAAEDILTDLAHAEPGWRIALLRYFNPIGAHESGLIGEDPRGVPGNLLPYIAQVAVGNRNELNVFGTDYPTRDGTGVRDYIHVMDLAEGHVAALEHLATTGRFIAANLGTGYGLSVLEVVHAFERASNRHIPLRFVARRQGDVAECYADPAFANRLLGWKAERDIDRMCADAWRWQSLNPLGYASETAGAMSSPLSSPHLRPRARRTPSVSAGARSSAPTAGGSHPQC